MERKKLCLRSDRFLLLVSGFRFQLQQIKQFSWINDVKANVFIEIDHTSVYTDEEVRDKLQDKLDVVFELIARDEIKNQNDDQPSSPEQQLTTKNHFSDPDLENPNQINKIIECAVHEESFRDGSCKAGNIKTTLKVDPKTTETSSDSNRYPSVLKVDNEEDYSKVIQKKGRAEKFKPKKLPLLLDHNRIRKRGKTLKTFCNSKTGLLEYIKSKNWSDVVWQNRINISRATGYPEECDWDVSDDGFNNIAAPKKTRIGVHFVPRTLETTTSDVFNSTRNDQWVDSNGKVSSWKDQHFPYSSDTRSDEDDDKQEFDPRVTEDFQGLETIKKNSTNGSTSHSSSETLSSVYDLRETHIYVEQADSGCSNSNRSSMYLSIPNSLDKIDDDLTESYSNEHVSMNLSADPAEGIPVNVSKVDIENRKAIDTTDMIVTMDTDELDKTENTHGEGVSMYCDGTGVNTSEMKDADTMGIKQESEVNADFDEVNENSIHVKQKVGLVIHGAGIVENENRKEMKKSGPIFEQEGNTNDSMPNKKVKKRYRPFRQAIKGIKFNPFSKGQKRSLGTDNGRFSFGNRDVSTTK